MIFAISLSVGLGLQLRTGRPSICLALLGVDDIWSSASRGIVIILNLILKDG